MDIRTDLVAENSDDIKRFIPENLPDIQKAVYSDGVVVILIRKDGDPQYGNVAVSTKLSP